ncbi:hypothetical protein ACTWP4_17385 [Gracilibacillus sp. D59]|uniref:hypothetical protein n=1 Tax=Gracilibacillus sp. D59 TaxID=3457434 RepID=UPI003FCCD779
MFFKPSESKDTRSVNIAYFCTFVYWSGFLLLNSFLELFGNAIDIKSIVLLLSGLAVFFASELFAKYLLDKEHKKVHIE